MNTIVETIEDLPLNRAWRGFIAAASAFGATIPAALNTLTGSGYEMPDALAAFVTDMARAASECSVAANEVTPAGFTVRIDPTGVIFTFGSGRSCVEMVFGFESDTEATLRFGLYAHEGGGQGPSKLANVYQSDP